ncbi:MAG: ribonuclease [Sphingomonadaceae bacterium]|nr:ribonuclease [Sphingomonadaceae bacterium]
MAEWLYEAGIGEARAARVEDGAIVEAWIEPEGDGPRAGAVLDARLVRILSARQGIAAFGGGEALVEPLPSGLTEGAALRIEIVREALPEPGKPKRAKARATDGALRDGSDLAARVAAMGVPVSVLSARGPDLLEAAGWSELLEEAVSGEVAFPGGSLRISPTPAMTLIDIDGTLDPAALAVAGARAAGEAIRRFGIGGSIGLDLPTLGSKAERQEADSAFDAALPQPFERTAVNGFGFMQIVRPRVRASLIEILREDDAPARALLRRAERSGLTGAVELVASSTIVRILSAHSEWLEAIARSLGGPVTLPADPALAIWAGYAAKAR